MCDSLHWRNAREICEMIINSKNKIEVWYCNQSSIPAHNQLFYIRCRISDLRAIMKTQQLAFPYCSRKYVCGLNISGEWVEHSVPFPFLAVPQRCDPARMVLGDLIEERQRRECRLLRYLERCCHEPFGKTAKSNGRWRSMSAGKKSGLETPKEENSGCLEVDFAFGSMC